MSPLEAWWLGFTSVIGSCVLIYTFVDSVFAYMQSRNRRKDKRAGGD